MRLKGQKKNKIHVITLGCSKNTVDSENLITQLKHNQFEVEHDADQSDAKVIVVNTCGFIERAKKESIDTILEYAEAKNEGRVDRLIVTGCLSQRYKDQLKTEIPEVDAWFGTMDLPALLANLQADYKKELLGERMISTPGHYAYLKISEGCNRTCSFCAIPLMRGGHVSRPMESLVHEAEFLAARGVKELILIAQELTYYGLDLYKKRKLPELLAALGQVEGIEWIRLHYAYPSKFPLEILDEMAVNPKICKYLDLPLQHASDAVLKAMRRQITKSETIDLIGKIRDKIPGIALRTTLLVGFPNETEKEFDELCDFITAMQFDRLGVFTYSPEEDTEAYSLQDLVPEEIKTARADRIMEIQRDISRMKNESKIGRILPVMIDRKEKKHWVGRSEADSPEVDQEIHLAPTKESLQPGNLVSIRITGAEDYDLMGEIV
ncbi:MAG TPA: 30S ribosomal protein S12 methylthiotransferase RimO [Saprospiraceae bacterium]|nr:30S ribosomal protein S12 methylthiotransferase RimO [Saprospiraceae bacterium]HNT20001.1 30S ribosomal protein S12 methylthiotransferase RimO [Saprospiraceae bacterium]